MADVIGQDDVVLRGIEKAAAREQLPGKIGPEELPAGAAGPVHDEDGVPHLAPGIPFGLADGAIVDPQLGQGAPGSELEALEDEIALDRGGILGRGGGRERGERGAEKWSQHFRTSRAGRRHSSGSRSGFLAAPRGAMHHDEIHPRRVNQELQLPLAPGQMGNEPGNEDDQRARPRRSSGSGDEQQDGADQLECGHQRQMAKAVLVQGMEQGLLPMMSSTPPRTHERPSTRGAPEEVHRETST